MELYELMANKYIRLLLKCILIYSFWIWMHRHKQNLRLRFYMTSCSLSISREKKNHSFIVGRTPISYTRIKSTEERRRSLQYFLRDLRYNVSAFFLPLLCTMLRWFVHRQLNINDVESPHRSFHAILVPVLVARLLISSSTSSSPGL